MTAVKGLLLHVLFLAFHIQAIHSDDRVTPDQDIVAKPHTPSWHPHSRKLGRGSLNKKHISHEQLTAEHYAKDESVSVEDEVTPVPLPEKTGDQNGSASSSSSPEPSADSTVALVGTRRRPQAELLPSELAWAPIEVVSNSSFTASLPHGFRQPLIEGVKLHEETTERKLPLNTKTSKEWFWVKSMNEEVLDEFNSEIRDNTARSQQAIAKFRTQRKEAGAAAQLCLEDCASQGLWSGTAGEAGGGGGGEPCTSSCCFNCDYAFGILRGFTLNGRAYRVEDGASGAEVYRARGVDGRKLFAKIQCVPGGKTTLVSKPRYMTQKETDTCAGQLQKAQTDRNKITRGRFKQMVSMAIVQLANDCGLGHLHVNTWVEEVTGAMPVLGVPIRAQEALMAEEAPGVSLNILVNSNEDPEWVTELMGRNTSQYVDLALHDLLFSEGDRHHGNVHIDEHGALRLIDNDGALGTHQGFNQWDKVRGVDSCFLPSTARSVTCLKTWPLSSVDYRCHAPGGAIGKGYPLPLRNCMRKFARSTPEALRREYLLPRQDQAEMLRFRSMQMLEMGFEAALAASLVEEKEKYYQLKADPKLKPKIKTTWSEDPGPRCAPHGNLKGR